MDRISNLCKVLVLCLTLSFASKAYSEPFIMETKMACDKAEVVLSFFRDENKSTMVWMGEVTEDIFQSLWLNEENNSWAMIAVNKKVNQACLVSKGVGFANFMSHLGKAI